MPFKLDFAVSMIVLLTSGAVFADSPRDAARQELEQKYLVKYNDLSEFESAGKKKDYAVLKLFIVANDGWPTDLSRAQLLHFFDNMVSEKKTDIIEKLVQGDYSDYFINRGLQYTISNNICSEELFKLFLSTKKSIEVFEPDAVRVAQRCRDSEILPEIIQKKYPGKASVILTEMLGYNYFAPSLKDLSNKIIQTAALIEMAQKEVGIVGLSFQPNEDGILVKDVAENSAAAESEIAKGDVILKINGENIKGLAFEVVRDKIAGKVDTSINILLKKGEDGSTQTLTLTRKPVDVDHLLADPDLNLEDYLKDGGLWNPTTQASIMKAIEAYEKIGKAECEEKKDLPNCKRMKEGAAAKVYVQGNMVRLQAAIKAIQDFQQAIDKHNLQTANQQEKDNDRRAKADEKYRSSAQYLGDQICTAQARIKAAKSTIARENKIASTAGAVDAAAKHQAGAEIVDAQEQIKRLQVAYLKKAKKTFDSKICK